MARFKERSKACQDAIVLVNTAGDKLIRARMEVEDHLYSGQEIQRLLDAAAKTLGEARALLEEKRDR